jgi:hypothetical protein
MVFYIFMRLVVSYNFAENHVQQFVDPEKIEASRHLSAISHEVATQLVGRGLK